MVAWGYELAYEPRVRRTREIALRFVQLDGSAASEQYSASWYGSAAQSAQCQFRARKRGRQRRPSAAGTRTQNGERPAS